MNRDIKVYICEDDRALGNEIVLLLRDEGIECALAHNSVELEKLVLREPPDLLLLDLQLHQETGLDIAARYRSSLPSLPVIFLSAHASVQNRIASYEAGAVLFLGKPFAPAELLAAIRSIVSRSDVPPEVKLDRIGKRLLGSLRTRHLSDKEFGLMQRLALSYPEITPYQELIDGLGLDPSKDARAYLEVIVSRLRGKLLRMHEPPLKILNKARQGYVLNQTVIVE